MSISERTLSHIWHDRGFSPEMRTTSGRLLSVVYPGVWTHSDGPDFADAMLELHGRLITGDVELHLRASDWFRHRHQHNPTYDGVVLHAVLENDLEQPVRSPSGNSIPTVELRQYMTEAILNNEDLASFLDLGSLGTSTCLPSLAGGQQDKIRRVLYSKGWERLVSKQLVIQQDFTVLPAGEVLYRRILDGLGLIHNRKGMALVGERFPLALVEEVKNTSGYSGLLAALLGTAGFLPLSDRQADVAGLSPGTANLLHRQFTEIADGYGINPVAVSTWSLNRVRPANHPVGRLASLADLLMKTGPDGLLITVLGLTEAKSTSWQAWLNSASPTIGQSRRRQLVTNVLAPFVAAYAAVYEDHELLAISARVWELIPGTKDDIIVRQTLKQIVGEARFPIRTALENQGLHQIGRLGCRRLRCFECPIAHLAIETERLR